jgi:hypothetical protein
VRSADISSFFKRNASERNTVVIAPVSASKRKRVNEAPLTVSASKRKRVSEAPVAAAATVDILGAREGTAAAVGLLEASPRIQEFFDFDKVHEC